MTGRQRAEQIYNYPLYSIKRFPRFLKYCWITAQKIKSQESNTCRGGGKLPIMIVLDMIWCNFRYGANNSRDYLLFEFWKKSASERNKFFTSRRYFKLIKHFDKDTFFNLFDKEKQYIKYADFIKRAWMLADENTQNQEIITFIGKYDRILVKPLSSEQGHGIYVIQVDDTDSIRTLIEDCKKNSYLLEEVCQNCQEFNAINSSSLNTLRVYAIVTKSGEVQLPSISLRCGCGGTVVDNWGSGGVGYPIDIESGVICASGVDKKGNRHIKHPGTDVIMPGFTIPRFSEACEVAKNIIRKDLKVVYAGLDLAILPDRIELIEVNFPGGHDFLQTLDQVGKNKTMKNINVQ